MTNKWQAELETSANPEKIKIFSSFFKTGKGEYGEGDKFIGLSVPANRKIAIQYYNLPFAEFVIMLQHPIHEFRLSALLALVHRYKKTKIKEEQKAIVEFYIDNSSCCNNWDLVDLSAPYILGDYLLKYPDSNLLDKLSHSQNLWQQRIAIVSTLTLIRHNRFDDALRLCKRYLTHPHQLIHKATGWMLREIGKRDISTLIAFLDLYAPSMPRTALRYAIEKLDTPTRQYYMKK